MKSNNMQEKIQKIRTAINIACPDLLKLEFGCEVKDRTKLYTGVWIFITKVEGTKMYIYRESTGQGSGLISDFETLGKPPTLADLLMTISYDMDGLAIRGRYLLIPDNHGGDISYDLYKGVLDQDEPTTEAIYKLIYKE